MTHNIRFYINDTVIENVTDFKYLGQIISADDYNDSAALLPKCGTTCTEFSVGT
jgi:hypothetical protein